MVVALSAAEGQTQEDGRSRVDTIDDRCEAEFLDVDAALLVEHGIAVKAGRNHLIPAGSRQHIADQLLDGKLVEGQVSVEGIYDPVTIGPDGSSAVLLIAVRIGVASGVQPVSGPSFTVVGRGQQSINQPFVGFGGTVLEKSAQLLNCRRKANQVEIEPAGEDFLVSFG